MGVGVVDLQVAAGQGAGHLLGLFGHRLIDLRLERVDLLLQGRRLLRIHRRMERRCPTLLHLLEVVDLNEHHQQTQLELPVVGTVRQRAPQVHAAQHAHASQRRPFDRLVDLERLIVHRRAEDHRPGLPHQVRGQVGELPLFRREADFQVFQLREDGELDGAVAIAPTDGRVDLSAEEQELVGQIEAAEILVDPRGRL